MCVAAIRVYVRLFVAEFGRVTVAVAAVVAPALAPAPPLTAVCGRVPAEGCRSGLDAVAGVPVGLVPAFRASAMDVRDPLLGKPAGLSDDVVVVVDGDVEEEDVDGVEVAFMA